MSESSSSSWVSLSAERAGCLPVVPGIGRLFDRIGIRYTKFDFEAGEEIEPVEVRGQIAHQVDQRGQFRQERSEVAAFFIDQPQTLCMRGAAGLDECEDPPAAPAWLEDVLVGVERRVGRLRQHRSQRTRQSREVAGETQGELVGHAAILRPFPLGARRPASSLSPRDGRAGRRPGSLRDVGGCL